MDSGKSVNDNALVLSKTKGKSIPSIFTLDILEPVAIIISFAFIL